MEKSRICMKESMQCPLYFAFSCVRKLYSRKMRCVFALEAETLYVSCCSNSLIVAGVMGLYAVYLVILWPLNKIKVINQLNVILNLIWMCSLYHCKENASKPKAAEWVFPETLKGSDARRHFLLLLFVTNWRNYVHSLLLHIACKN